MKSAKKEYKFEQLQAMSFEAEQDEQEENLLLRAYARIAPPDTGLNDGGGDSYGGQNCDNGGPAQLCP